MRTLLLLVISGCRSSTPAPPTQPTSAPADAKAKQPGQPHEAHADFEYGLDGPGPGGGGVGWGVVGASNTATANPPSPRIEIGEPVLSSPGIEAAWVGRYARHTLEQVRACYEQQLVASPTLEGTVNVTFTIGTDGVMAGANAGGMGNTTMETCVAAASRRVRFVPPMDGKPVGVTYSLTFHPPGH